MSKGLVVIVDAVSSGNLLAPAFRRKGYATWHVLSDSKVLDNFGGTLVPQDFERFFVYDGDLDGLTGHLSEVKPIAVVAGAESGVLLADRLAARFGLPGNRIDVSLARRDKYEMAERLRQSGIRSIRSFKTTNLNDLSHWLKDLDSFPVVLKPTRSAGSDNVFCCRDERDAELAFRRIMDSATIFGEPNDAVLAQELIRGQDYVIDSVSCQGRHFVTSMWRYQKRLMNGAAFVFDHASLIEATGADQDVLRAYIENVLNALGIENGPAHSEVIMTGNGPVLVECGARLHGCGAPEINSFCTGVDPVELTVLALTEPSSFLNATTSHYQILTNLLVVDLISQREGIVTTLDPFQELKQLESFRNLRIGLSAGGPLAKTVDLLSSPGIVELTHADVRILADDLATIRRHECESLYERVIGETA